MHQLQFLCVGVPLSIFSCMRHDREHSTFVHGDGECRSGYRFWEGGSSYLLTPP